VNQTTQKFRHGWFQDSLTRRFLTFLLAVLGTVSAGFLTLFLFIYGQEISQERQQASRSLNLLLQVSLENAMLKRDLSGLQGIVERLGTQKDILDVMILNPQGEIRFAADPSQIGKQADGLITAVCPDCIETASAQAITGFLENPNGQRIMRSLQPVANRPVCSQCHGSPEHNPINGILAVDYDAGSIQQKAQRSLLGMLFAGLVTLCLATWAAWWFMHRFVLRPVAALDQASAALSAGNLDQRVAIPGYDELARLGQSFNTMADHLRHKQRQLARQERFLQDIIDAIPDGIRVIDQDYKIIKANRAYCEQVDQAMPTVIGQACYRSSHQRDTPCPPTLLSCPLHEIHNRGEAMKCIQQFQRQDEFIMPVEIYAAAMTGQNNGASKPLIVESIRDLSKQIEYSHEQKLAGLGELAAGVAHEIRNPLASVRIALQASLRALNSAQIDPDELNEYLNIVDQKVDNCLDVTDRLLKLSALSSQQTELVELNQAISDTLSLLQFEAEQTNVRIQLDLAPEQPRLLANDNDLRMIVLNLAQNGFHAMPQGGTLEVSSRCEEQAIELIVEDSGPGIPADVFPYIFDPFFSARADNNKGTGLGLTITKTLVERHQGRIEVSSPPGRGAQFKIIFPTLEQTLTA